MATFIHQYRNISIPRFVIVSIICAAGGFLFGMDTGIIGPVTTMPQFIVSFGAYSSTVHGLIVSSILIPAAISSFFAGHVADLLGRSKAITIGSFIFGVGTAIEAGAAHLAMFIVGRIVTGVGEGLFLSTLVVYICEISPPSSRGPLTSAPQLWVTFGLMTGFFTCYGTINIESSSLAWRLPFAIQSVLAFAFAATSFFSLPQSPRWLTLKGRSAEAISTWEHLGVGPAEREKEANESLRRDAPLVITTSRGEAVALEVELEAATAEKSGRNSMWKAFEKDVWPRTALAVFIMGMQQLSGIDGVLYYAPLLFQQAGLSSSSASFLASGVSALLIFAVTIPALIFSDRWGRRHSTILGGLALSATMFLIGSLYAGRVVHSSSGAGRWVVIVCIYLFAIIYSISWAVGIKVYSAEVQPQKTRAAATSLAHGSNWAVNFLVALTTPVLLAHSSFGAYFLFGGCSLLTAMVCAVFMPETQGKSLEDIDRAFSQSTFRGVFRVFSAKLRRTVRIA